MDVSKIDTSAYPHSTAIQIRFSDVDMAGHVNNATFLSYFETGRVEFFDRIIGWENDWKNRGLIIAHAEIDYITPVYLHDKIKVYSRVARVGTKSFTIENLLVKVQKEKEVFASVASFVLVCFDYAKLQTMEIPAEWKEKLLSKKIV